jgi:hypothetical protein
MKQTAVKWFASKVMYLNISPKEMHDFLDWYEEAKEMEKKQKIEFANNYGFHICGYDYENAEQYYNETYGDDT